MKRFFIIFFVVMIVLPLSIVLTWLLLPFWNWIEKYQGIESVGHSGPANWCYITSAALAVSISFGILILVTGKKS